MSEREVKTRKPHKCDSCGGQINAGEIALYGEGKNARYDEKDCNVQQVGIEYWRYYICSTCMTEVNSNE